LLLSLAGGALGILFAVFGLKALMAFVPANLAVIQNAGLNLWVLGFALAICIASGLVSGLLPSLRTLRTNLVSVLKEGAKGSSAAAHRHTHNLLVVSEVAMALIPLVCAGLLLRSFQHLLQVDPGFRSEHVLTLEVPHSSMSFEDYNKLKLDQQLALVPNFAVKFEQISGQIRALPGVKEVGGIDTLPLTNELRRASRFVIEGQPILAAGARPLAQTRNVSLSYFSSLDIPLRAGRFFTADDWKLSNIIVNQTMAVRYWGFDAGALGKRVNLCSLDPKPCWYEVIGVVGDVHQLNLESPQTCDVYFSGGWTPYIIVRADSDPTTLVAAITEVIHKADPTLPIAHILTMDDQLSESISPRRFSAMLIGIFAALALLLSAVGIYGVMSYTVSQRTQEIGIRVAMGAQRSTVQRMILAQSLKLTLAGVALGLSGAFLLVRFLSTLLFGIGAYDLVTFAGVALLLLVVALAASYIPARRAVNVDPMAALRSE
jgi:putative ABC transport system permease protein